MHNHANAKVITHKYVKTNNELPILGSIDASKQHHQSKLYQIKSKGGKTLVELPLHTCDLTANIEPLAA